MLCANLLGGPATNLGWTGNFGAIYSDAKRPSGLKRGPAATLARNPYSITSTSGWNPDTTVASASSTTPAATERAAYSLTGLGKVNVFDICDLIPIILIIIVRN